MLHDYDETLTHKLIIACSNALRMSPADMLHSFGDFLVTDPSMNAIRRLLRFSGTDFIDFLAALPDLDGRAKLAVPDLEIPPVGVREVAQDEFELVCANDWGFAYLIMGTLTALAEDYGALVTVDLMDHQVNYTRISVRVLDVNHSTGKDFSLVEVA